MMPLHIITSTGESFLLRSPKDFEKAFCIRYLPHLQFANAKIQTTIEKQHRKALYKEWITPRQKWLGHYYAQDLQEELLPSLTIAWINTAIGYGVFTNTPIPAGSFIGEYTGLLRKRSFWQRGDNLYCFDYTIGARKSSSIVIDSQDAGNHTRFLNHSFHPNVALISVYFQSMIRVILYAKAPIQAGAQLCYDYGERYWKRRGKPKELGLCPFQPDL